MPHNECPGYDIKQSNGEAPVMLQFLGNAEYSIIAIALKPGVVAHDRVLSTGQIELFDI